MSEDLELQDKKTLWESTELKYNHAEEIA